jgi:ATP-dependent Clp protease ATP-binding subunit ClpC
VDPSTAFDRLSADAKRVLGIAREEGRHAAAAYLGTEHVLLGVLGVEGGLGARVLAGVGLDLAAGRSLVAAAPHRPAAIVPTGAIPTSRVRRVIELAFEEALRTGSSVVTTGALLVGLILEEDGLASHLLRERGVTAEAARDALRRFHDAGVTETVE